LQLKKRKTDNPALIKNRKGANGTEAEASSSSIGISSAESLKRQKNDNASFKLQRPRVHDESPAKLVKYAGTVQHQQQQLQKKSATPIIKVSKIESQKSQNIHSADKDKMSKKELLEKAELQVKSSLKPFYANDEISKDTYKIIMRKCVEKVYDKSKVKNVETAKVENLVKAYVSKYT
jgi:hypothetical protein